MAAEKKLPDWLVYSLEEVCETAIALAQAPPTREQGTTCKQSGPVKLSTTWPYSSSVVIALLDQKDLCWASSSLYPMIGCCGMMVSTGARVPATVQGNGVGQELMKLKLAIAKRLGYTVLQATCVKRHSAAEVHILQKFGWKEVGDFVNKRTGNTVSIFLKNLLE